MGSADSAEELEGTSREILLKAICSRCLQTLSSRCQRPVGAAYAGGVQCDYCCVELVHPATTTVGIGCDPYLHCGRCWFDLCQACAMHEMQEVWWGESGRNST